MNGNCEYRLCEGTRLVSRLKNTSLAKIQITLDGFPHLLPLVHVHVMNLLGHIIQVALLFIGRNVFISGDRSVIHNGYSHYGGVSSPNAGSWWIFQEGVVLVVSELRWVISSALLTWGALGSFARSGEFLAFLSSRAILSHVSWLFTFEAPLFLSKPISSLCFSGVNFCIHCVDIHGIWVSQ
jgi:hypothetical protein